jgi:hypothetical protein
MADRPQYLERKEETMTETPEPATPAEQPDPAPGEETIAEPATATTPEPEVEPSHGDATPDDA